MEIWTVILFVTGCGIGIILGGVLSLSFLSRSRNRKKKDAEPGKEKQKGEFKDHQEPDEEPAQEGLLQKRLGKKKGTWTELNCSADDVSEEDHIKDSRKKQNDAYRYAKRKKD